MNNESEKRYPPPLDMPPPTDKEAEWALLRIAFLCDIPADKGNWEELGEAITKKIMQTNQGNPQRP